MFCNKKNPKKVFAPPIVVSKKVFAPPTTGVKKHGAPPPGCPGDLPVNFDHSLSQIRNNFQHLSAKVEGGGG